MTTTATHNVVHLTPDLTTSQLCFILILRFIKNRLNYLMFKLIQTEENTSLNLVDSHTSGSDLGEITEATVVTPKPDVQHSVLDGEAVLLDLESGLYYTLNRVGTVAWEYFTADYTLSQVHKEICERFDIDGKVARRDLFALVTHLSQEGLIQLNTGDKT